MVEGGPAAPGLPWMGEGGSSATAAAVPVPPCPQPGAPSAVGLGCVVVGSPGELIIPSGLRCSCGGEEMAEGKQKGDFTDWPRAGEKRGDHGVYPGTLPQGVRWLAGLVPKVAWEDSGGAVHPTPRKKSIRQEAGPHGSRAKTSFWPW